MTEDQLFERGLQRRREVLGAEYVDANLSESDDFMMAFQRAGGSRSIASASQADRWDRARLGQCLLT